MVQVFYLYVLFYLVRSRSESLEFRSVYQSHLEEMNSEGDEDGDNSDS